MNKGTQMLKSKGAGSSGLLWAAVASCACLASCATPEERRLSEYVDSLDQRHPASTAPAGVQVSSVTQRAPGAPQVKPPETLRTLSPQGERAPAPPGPLSLTVSQAVLSALENNRSLVVQRYNPSIQRTFEQQQRAVFDPDLAGLFSFDSNRVNQPTVPPTLSHFQDYTGRAGISEFLPTGTHLGLTGGATVNEFPADRQGKFASDVALTATQSLLRGFGLAANLASLRQARLDTLSSEYELRGLAESLVAQTEETYWDLALAKQQIDIFTNSLSLAQQQMAETRERIRLGKVAETELVAAEAEAALRREDLINARSALDTTRLQLLRLVNLGADAFEKEVILAEPPTVPNEPLDNLSDHLQLARQMRPDLNQARLQIDRGDLEVVKTKNGLLPKLDLFVSLGRTGYARSFGDSASNLGGSNYDLLAGVSLEYPIGNRDSKARYNRAVLTREQAKDAVANLAQLIEVDVRTGYIEILRAKEQVTATAATRKLQEEKLRVEQEKFRVGKSTAFLVGQAQRDLLASQISEIRAVVNCRKAVAELYRLEGSLLSRRGLVAPGAAPPSGPQPLVY